MELTTKPNPRVPDHRRGLQGQWEREHFENVFRGFRMLSSEIRSRSVFTVTASSDHGSSVCYALRFELCECTNLTPSL